MGVVEVLDRFYDFGIRVLAIDDKLVVESSIPLTEEQRVFIREHKKQIMTQITKDTVNGITLSELKEVAGEDWPDIEHDQKMIEALAGFITIRHMRERGEIPPDYTHIAICAGCGPVWLFVAGHVQGCPWCFNRKKGLLIPRPEGAET